MRAVGKALLLQILSRTARTARTAHRKGPPTYGSAPRTARDGSEMHQAW
jgi:hypothetical protein